MYPEYMFPSKIRVICLIEQNTALIHSNKQSKMSNPLTQGLSNLLNYIQCVDHSPHLI